MYRGELREGRLNGHASEIPQTKQKTIFNRCELREVATSLEDGEAATSCYGHLTTSEND